MKGQLAEQLLKLGNLEAFSNKTVESFFNDSGSDSKLAKDYNINFWKVHSKKAKNKLPVNNKMHNLMLKKPNEIKTRKASGVSSYQSAKILELRIDENYFSLKEENRKDNSSVVNNDVRSIQNASSQNASPATHNISASYKSYLGYFKDKVSSIKEFVVNNPNQNN